MAHHKSAKKRARQMLVRKAQNRHARSSLRTAVKAADVAIRSGEPGEAAALRYAEGTIRKAASKGVIPKKRASRQVSRLAKRANARNA